MKPIEGKSEARCYEGERLRAVQNTTGWTLRQLIDFINFQRFELNREVKISRPKGGDK